MDDDRMLMRVLTRLSQVTPRPETVSSIPSRSTLPAPDRIALVQSWIASRNRRLEFLSGEWIADPGWNILLHLYLARLEGRVSTSTAAGDASGVAPTTALRWLVKMGEAGLIVREHDRTDKRRHHVRLSQKMFEELDAYVVAEIELLS